MSNIKNNYNPYITSNNIYNNIGNNGSGNNIYNSTSDVSTYIENTIAVEIDKFKFQYNIEFVSNIIRFFNFDYNTGEELLNLIKTGDPDNNKMAIIMLFGGVKEQIKSEIIAEIFK